MTHHHASQAQHPTISPIAVLNHFIKSPKYSEMDLNPLSPTEIYKILLEVTGSHGRCAHKVNLIAVYDVGKNNIKKTGIVTSPIGHLHEYSQELS